jgi:hypothetical protein
MQAVVLIHLALSDSIYKRNGMEWIGLMVAGGMDSYVTSLCLFNGNLYAWWLLYYCRWELMQEELLFLMDQHGHASRYWLLINTIYNLRVVKWHSSSLWGNTLLIPLTLPPICHN